MSRPISANDVSTFRISLSSAAARSSGAPRQIQRGAVLLEFFEQAGELVGEVWMAEGVGEARQVSPWRRTPPQWASRGRFKGESDTGRQPRADFRKR